MAPSETLRIADVRVDRVDMREALARIEGFVELRTPHRVVTVNLEYLRHAHSDPRFREALEAADLAVADGMPLVWMSRLFRRPLRERIAGVDLADRCAWLSARQGYRLFLLGAAGGVAESTAKALRERNPGLIVETYAPPIGEFSPEEELRIEALIAAAQPDILLVALPTPRQELWNHANARRWNVPVVIGVGAAFDMIGGEVGRAPAWMRRSGMEWLFRLVKEPRRLWKRYLVHDAAVLFRIMRSRVAS